MERRKVPSINNKFPSVIHEFSRRPPPDVPRNFNILILRAEKKYPRRYSTADANHKDGQKNSKKKSKKRTDEKRKYNLIKDNAPYIFIEELNAGSCTASRYRAGNDGSKRWMYIYLLLFPDRERSRRIAEGEILKQRDTCGRVKHRLMNAI